MCAKEPLRKRANVFVMPWMREVGGEVAAFQSMPSSIQVDGAGALTSNSDDGLQRTIENPQSHECSDALLSSYVGVLPLHSVRHLLHDAATCLSSCVAVAQNQLTSRREAGCASSCFCRNHLMQIAIFIWGFLRLGVPYWGPYYKGILKIGGPFLGPPAIFVNPHKDMAKVNMARQSGYDRHITIFSPEA